MLKMLRGTKETSPGHHRDQGLQGSHDPCICENTQSYVKEGALRGEKQNCTSRGPGTWGGGEELPLSELPRRS